MPAGLPLMARCQWVRPVRRNLMWRRPDAAPRFKLPDGQSAVAVLRARCQVRAASAGRNGGGHRRLSRSGQGFRLPFRGQLAGGGV